jgi:hypothetical protein
VAGEFPPPLRAQQIRPTDRTDEQSVTSQHSLRISRVRDQKRDVLGCMAWRVQRCNRHVTETELFAVARFTVWHAKTSAGSGDGHRAGGREFVRSRHEIGVHVGLECKRQGEAVPARELYVDVDVTTGIDDRRQASAIAAHHE